MAGSPCRVVGRLLQWPSYQVIGPHDGQGWAAMEDGWRGHPLANVPVSEWMKAGSASRGPAHHHAGSGESEAPAGGPS